MSLWSKLGLLLTSLFVSACSNLGTPPGASPVTHFDSQRYLGTWYEIARLDHRFERGLEQVTANYSPRSDGGLKVINRGYNAKKAQWQQSEGKAYFVGSSQTGALKVSFFGPFYGSYNVIALDPEYGYALVTGPTTDYLWILARQPQLDSAIRDRLVAQAKALGFTTDKLIWVQH